MIFSKPVIHLTFAPIHLHLVFLFMLLLYQRYYGDRSIGSHLRTNTLWFANANLHATTENAWLLHVATQQVVSFRP